MNKNIRRLGRGLLALIYPPVCPVCERAISIFDEGNTCKKCLDKVPPRQDVTCKKCGRVLSSTDVECCDNCLSHSFHFVRGYIVFIYEGLIRKLILDFKYYGRRDLGLFFKNQTMEKYGDEIKALQADAIIPIPVHRKKLIKRGYNQAEAYGSYLSETLGIPCLGDILLRVKETEAQKELTALGRLTNLLDAFAVDRERFLEHKKRMKLNRVILVDDIFTTGATVECATLLLNEVGIKEVYVVCISAPRPL